MADSEGEGGGQYCLKWNNYQESLSSTFSDLLASATFVDVTLSCEGSEVVRAHRLLLAACSPYFRRLLAGLASHHHPVILLRDVQHNHLVGILEFIYNGEVSVEQAQLGGFLAAAELLGIRGLTGEAATEEPTRDSSIQEADITFPMKEEGVVKEEEQAPGKVQELQKLYQTFSPPVGLEGVEGGKEGEGLEGLEGKKTCPFCLQQLSWHALSRHIRDMHSRATADVVICQYCKKTFRNKNSLGCHIWRFHKRGKELIEGGVPYSSRKERSPTPLLQHPNLPSSHLSTPPPSLLSIPSLRLPSHLPHLSAPPHPPN